MSRSRDSRRHAGRVAIADLDRYRQTVSLDRFLADRDTQRMVLHALLVAIQACVDEALAECRLRGLEPDTYRAAFEQLGQAGALPAEWVPDLMRWASLRNIIAHFYPVVDMTRVHQSLSEVAILGRFLDFFEPGTS